MDLTEVARALGRRGGRARAERLSSGERRRIAALGGHARRRAVELTRRVAENFRYVETVDALRGGAPVVVSRKTCRGPLPGLYPPAPCPPS